MSMQQPVPPENQQPIAPQEPAMEVTADAVPQEPVAPATPEVTQDAQPQVDQQAQEQQVIEEVAQGLADEEITASDIMTAVLADSLGLSPAGAQSLFQILMSELEADVNEDIAPVDQPPME